MHNSSTIHPNTLLLWPCLPIMARHGSHSCPPLTRQLSTHHLPNYHQICSTASLPLPLFHLPLTMNIFIQPLPIPVLACLENVRAGQHHIRVVVLPLNVVMADAGCRMIRRCSYPTTPRNFGTSIITRYGQSFLINHFCHLMRRSH